MNKIYNSYAVIISLVGFYVFWSSNYVGGPRSGKIISAILVFLIVCLFADKFASQKYADIFLKFFCCLSLTILVSIL
jgi:hypothetical protein